MKIIWFTQRVMLKEEYNERWNTSDQRISEFIHWCGYLPIAVPANINILRELAVGVKPSGIVLTGGNDLVKYGGNAPERDSTERWLIDYAKERKIPVLGVCRGMQVILDYYGCSLNSVDGHVAKYHELLGSFLGTHVNSFHSFGAMIDDVKRLPVQIKAYTDDGVVEAVSVNGEKIEGIMWHPEREMPFREMDKMLFQTLFR